MPPVRHSHALGLRRASSLVLHSTLKRSFIMAASRLSIPIGPPHDLSARGNDCSRLIPSSVRRGLLAERFVKCSLYGAICMCLWHRVSPYTA